METDNEKIPNPISYINKNDFATAKDIVNHALYTKASEYIAFKKQEIAKGLVDSEVNDGRETSSGEG